MKNILHCAAAALAVLSLARCAPATPSEPEKTMSATLSQSSVALPFAEPTKVSYTLSDAGGEVSVEVDGLPKEITFSNSFSGSASGTIELTSSLDEDREVDVKVVFADRKTTVKRDLKIQTARKKNPAPSEPAFDLKSDVIYPAGCGQVLSVPFTVACQSAVETVTVEAGTGLAAELELASDRKSGTIRVSATPELGEAADVTLKAANSAGESSASFSLARAFLNVDKESFNVGCKGTANGYSLNVSTNLDVEIAVDDPQGFVDAEIKDRLVRFTVKENASYAGRTATVSVREPLGKLDRTVLISQAGVEGDNASDRAALIALYDALNMKEWEENGCFGFYYRNWCTDEPMDKWLGVELTGYNGQGRVMYVHLVGEQPNSTGYIPEELGQLTKLKEFQMYPGHKITHLPESIRNLVNLGEFTLQGCVMDMDLASWTGLTELMHNPNKKLWDINFCRTGLHGTIPEWLCTLPEYGNFEITGCHFSGQVPDSVANAAFWSKKTCYAVEDLEACPRFDKTKYELTEDGWYYKMTQGEGTMYLQADNYALWVGERPSNTRWVDDKFGGHWEWTE